MSESLSAVALEAYRARVLIVENDEAATRFLAKALDEQGYDTEICPTSDAALATAEQGCEVIITAVRGPGMDGLELLRHVRARRPDVAVILLAADNSVTSAVAAMREGAFDYVTKPLSADALIKTVARAIEMGSLQRENRRLRQQLDVASTAAGFIAESPQSKQLVAMVRRVAPSRSTALIEGESGTGKELIARMLHYWSARADGPFVAVNCKAFADGVVESELFGHEKGSFTGAIAARAGCFERASGGTLFLDEIAEAGTDFQAKLLRVLEDGEVLRVGASKTRKVDVRIVAATNRVLRNEVAAGRFRADLYFRLNVIPVKIAPLRERREDILPLARHFLAYYTAQAGRPITLVARGRTLARQLLLARQRARAGKCDRALGGHERGRSPHSRGLCARRRHRAGVRIRGTRPSPTKRCKPTSTAPPSRVSARRSTPPRATARSRRLPSAWTALLCID